MAADASLRAASPCIGVCRLDPKGGLCLGCRRTLKEIAAWPGLAPEERARILASLRGRKAASPPGTRHPSS
ncbi:MAG TPA: DUF1289 domain-containing protein [Alphaproteobacteria bacterium]|nr:DUF1289 domain-containing protein [Alphaproteobacteria bacterium]